MQVTNRSRKTQEKQEKEKKNTGMDTGNFTDNMEL